MAAIMGHRSPSPLTASNSSLLRSSSITSNEDAFSESIHFEEIGLDDTSDDMPWKKSEPTTMSPRDLTGPKVVSEMRRRRESFDPRGDMKGDIRVGRHPIHATSLPRRGLMNSSTPSLSIKDANRTGRTRPPSPLKHMISTSLPRSMSNGHTPVSNVRTCPPRPSSDRRASSQRSRKSIQELEDEYDDLDEHLPDDASLFNVPISPRASMTKTPTSPGGFFDKHFVPRSPNTIIQGSTTPRPESRNKANKSPVSPIRPPFVKSPEIMREVSRSTRRSFVDYHQRPNISRDNTNGYSYGYPGLPKSRAKSWSAAMSDLSEEARALTGILESFASSAESGSSSGSENRQDERLKKLVRPRTIDLPPLRTGNVMIDPLPVSKEKEKVLSRTRPSWLPPKNPAEEKKHLREYQQMMERSQRSDQEKASRSAQGQCVKDDTQEALLRIWQEHVIPDWANARKEPRIRELWWRGIPSKMRAQVWELAVGNELTITEATFAKALQRAKDLDVPSSDAKHVATHQAWFSAVRRDVTKTLPEVKIFQPGAPAHNDLVDLLMAYSMYRSDVGYSHGTHLIAALLLLTFPSLPQAFLCLCNLLNRPLPLAFLTGDASAMDRTYHLVLSLLRHKFPRLHTHLFTTAEPSSLNLHPHPILEPIIRTLFLGPGTQESGLGLDIAARIWDVMVFEGDGIVIRSVVAVLGILEAELYGCSSREEVLAKLGWGATGEGMRRVREMDPERFMAEVRAAGKEEKGRF